MDPPHQLELVFHSCHPLNEDVNPVNVADDCLCVAHPDVGELSEIT